jgi:23S rRNA (adenine2503-C2)-methyltransferase
LQGNAFFFFLVESMTFASENRPLHFLLKEELEESLKVLGQPAYRAGQVLQWAYDREKRVESWDGMTNLPAALRSSLAERHPISLPEVVTVS